MEKAINRWMRQGLYDTLGHRGFVLMELRMDGDANPIEPEQRGIAEVEGTVGMYVDLGAFQDAGKRSIPFCVQCVNFVRLFFERRLVQSADERQRFGVVGDGEVGKPVLFCCFCHGFHGVGAVCPRGLRLQVSADRTVGKEVWERALAGGFQLVMADAYIPASA
jgi:hypothetical protein